MRVSTLNNPDLSTKAFLFFKRTSIHFLPLLNILMASRKCSYWPINISLCTAFLSSNSGILPSSVSSLVRLSKFVRGRKIFLSGIFSRPTATKCTNPTHDGSVAFQGNGDFSTSLKTSRVVRKTSSVGQTVSVSAIRGSISRVFRLINNSDSLSSNIAIRSSSMERLGSNKSSSLGMYANFAQLSGSSLKNFGPCQYNSLSLSSAGVHPLVGKSAGFSCVCTCSQGTPFVSREITSSLFRTKTESWRPGR